MTRATGKDDPALAETSWPLPDDPIDQDSLEWRMRNGRGLSIQESIAGAEILAAYRALVCGGTTRGQTERLAALRRVQKRRTK